MVMCATHTHTRTNRYVLMNIYIQAPARLRTLVDLGPANTCTMYTIRIFSHTYN